MRSILRALTAVAVATASASCGSVVRSSRSPVLLTINSLGAAPGQVGTLPTTFGGFLDSSVLTTVTSPAPCTTANPCRVVISDVGQVVLSISLKDIGPVGSTTTPSPNNAVTIKRYHVDYVRSDGRNVVGVDVPYSIDGAVTGTVFAGATTQLTFEIVLHTAKEQPPLLQLINSPNVIATLAQVTFYGTDQVGNDISVSGSIQIDFGDFGG